ncbi:RHS repeat-associated core domain-containing protein [Reyranella soli]|uniref:RHS repeat-associated core domain-containing protein n=1 Tax=Reyranella soli TaxID=1230389 RepID=UPI001478AEB4|nr:RHS repeat-associated core domain-containing protein [Reyranella soli]
MAIGSCDYPTRERIADGYFFAGYRSEEDDANGTQHVIYYNPRGKPVFDIQDAAGLNRVTATVYDGLDRLSAVTQPEGGSTSWTYNNTVNPWVNNVATVTRNPKPGSPLSATTTSYVYEPTFNKPTRVTDALGRVALAEYDPWTGNAVSATADVGTAPHFNARTQFTYNSVGLVTSVTDPMGSVTRFDYDGYANRILSIADAGTGRLNLTTTWAYNARGDVVSVTDPRGKTATSTYDDARRLITTTSPGTSAAPAGVVTTNTYDPDGRLLQVQQAAGGSVLRTTSSTYTPTGKAATTTDARGNVTRYTYDPLERLASVTDAEGRIAQFTYDALSRPYRTYNTAIQAGPLVQRTYTADGLLASLADANSNTTSFAYDGFDRPATTTYPLGSTETFTYDARDNLLGRKTRAAATTNIAFGYDTLNRLTSKTPTSGPVVTYSYDLSSRPTGVSDNSAAITPAAPPGGSTVTYGTSYAYDALNRLTGTTWDPAPAATAPTAGPLVTFGHTYNKVNQRIGQTVNDNNWLSYPAGARTTDYKQTPANPLNQYTTIATTGQPTITPTYDGNGNLTSDGTYTLGYDVENRLTSVNGAGNTASYAFDTRGRCKSRTVNGTTTISVTDADDREVLEYDGGTGALLRWYAYGLGPNAVLNQMNIAGSTRAIYVPDILGSVIATFDSTGALMKSAYQPYGTSAAAATPFGYTGQRIDTETGGNYYYRARHYSPVLGRFMQPDPNGYTSNLNLYNYVGNDPLNRADPLGLWSVDVNLIFAGFSFGIGENSGQAFIVGRFGDVGIAATITPQADIPLGDSGRYPCHGCATDRVSWDVVKGGAGFTLGPVDAQLISAQGSTIVNEYGRSGNFQRSTSIPSDVNYSAQYSMSGKIGARVEPAGSLYQEIGTSLSWSDVRSFLGMQPLPSAPPQGSGPAAPLPTSPSTPSPSFGADPTSWPGPAASPAPSFDIGPSPSAPFSAPNTGK